jgi:hypothetical protein
MTYYVEQQAERERLERELVAIKRDIDQLWLNARARYRAAPIRSREEAEAFAEMGRVLAEMETRNV